MAIFLLACKEMVTRVKKLDLDGSSSLRVLSAGFTKNNILAFFCRLIRFIIQQFIQRYAYQSHYSGLCAFVAMF